MLKSLLSKLVGNKQQAATERAHEPHLDPATEALLRAIEEKRKTDPLIGAKLGGKEVFQRLLQGMKGERGVHIESLLCALGALVKKGTDLYRPYHRSSLLAYHNS